MESKKKILAVVGMPGAGKSEVAALLKDKRLPFVRFGEQTEIGLQENNLPVTPENERIYREKIRRQLGMAAYAIKAQAKITAMLETHDTVVIDGLYSWEEYVYLKEKFPQLLLIAIIAQRNLRYERLGKRATRPFSQAQASKRDVDEIENLNKGGPVAIADYFIENNGTIEQLDQKTNALLKRLHIGTG